MDEGLRNAIVASVISGVLAAGISILIGSFTIGRKVGNIEKSIGTLETRVEGHDTDFSGVEVKIGEYRDEVINQYKEMKDNLGVLTEKVGALEVRLVEKIGQVEVRLVDRIARLETPQSTD